jgi:hypothetical protein
MLAHQTWKTYQTVGKYRIGRERTYHLSDPADAIRFAARERYVWPGGHIIVAILDGALLCSDCLRERYRIELRDAIDGATKDAILDHEGNFDGPEYCEHCGHAFGVAVD